jgi:hypothetical protein
MQGLGLHAARRKYVVQWSTNLATWSDLRTVTNYDENSNFLATITNSPSAAAAFYRSRLLP